MRLTLLLAFLFSSGLAFGADYWLLMRPGGLGGYCDPTLLETVALNYVPAYSAGAMAELTLSVRRAEPPRRPEYSGPDNILPSGLILEVGRWDTTRRLCQWDPALRERLQLRYLKGPNSEGDLHFTLVFPDSMADQLLGFSARWIGSEWGDLVSVPDESGYNDRLGDICTPRPLIVRVRPPCSDTDRQRARESHIYEAWLAGDWPRTITLAESLLANGGESFSVLMYAMMATKELGQVEQALQHLDRCYQHYGRVGAPGDSLSRASEYERMRKQLLDKQNTR